MLFNFSIVLREKSTIISGEQDQDFWHVIVEGNILLSGYHDYENAGLL